MRIISWNCSMAFYKKRHLIEALLPDVAISLRHSHVRVDGARSINPHAVAVIGRPVSMPAG